MLVLEIGGERTPQAHMIPGWEEAEIMTLDIDPEFSPDILSDAKDIPEEWYGKFDGVFAAHVLEHFGFWEYQQVLEEWKKLLKVGGELHIVVPSAEWAARQILSENPSWATMPHLFGSHTNEWQVHKSTYTMVLLRKAFDNLGLGVQRARTGAYQITITGGDGVGRVLKAEQHYVMGVKK